MKTILIPIFHGHTSRNLLRTNVLPLMIKRVKVVLVVPSNKVKFFQQEFRGVQVTIVPSPEIKFSSLDRFFRFFYYYFVDTITVKIIHGEQFWITGRYLKYFFARLLTLIFGNSRFLRRAIRWMDCRWVSDTLFSGIFDIYRPDLLLIPSITSDSEGLVLRQAKKRGIKTIGMVRSWDNLTVNKGNIRVFPDRLLVHSEFLRGDVTRYADYPASRVVVVGMSHFDHYFTGRRLSREEFFRSIGGVSDKKTIFLTLIGQSEHGLDQFLVDLIARATVSSMELKNVQLLVRTHPNENKPSITGTTNTIITTPLMVNFPSSGPSEREFTPTDMNFFADALYHSDVVVSVQSTTTIDAAAFDKPVINVAFDKYPNTNYLRSVRRFYDFTHYQTILKSGGVKVAFDQDHLIKLIILALAHPEDGQDGRKQIVLGQNGGFADGGASERTVEAVLADF